MPSAHRRIPVARDPELDAALRAAQPHLSSAERRSEAATVRALALRGAAAVTGGLSVRESEHARALAPLVAQAPRKGWEDFVAPQAEGDDPYAGSSALQWVRGER